MTKTNVSGVVQNIIGQLEELNVYIQGAGAHTRKAAAISSCSYAREHIGEVIKLLKQAEPMLAASDDGALKMVATSITELQSAMGNLSYAKVHAHSMVTVSRCSEARMKLESMVKSLEAIANKANVIPEPKISDRYIDGGIML